MPEEIWKIFDIFFVALLIINIFDMYYQDILMHTKIDFEVCLNFQFNEFHTRRITAVGRGNFKANIEQHPWHINIYSIQIISQSVRMMEFFPNFAILKGLENFSNISSISQIHVTHTSRIYQVNLSQILGKYFRQILGLSWQIPCISYICIFHISGNSRKNLM